MRPSSRRGGCLLPRRAAGARCSARRCPSPGTRGTAASPALPAWPVPRPGRGCPGPNRRGSTGCRRISFPPRVPGSVWPALVRVPAVRRQAGWE
ncbi:CxxxxCH/CxxCH domain-containing protein [Pseudomonas sp. SO81]|uniref:CxxxxCH/CxxCH domain-containing protein n=1 Tax=Pseudomonas sp. SO81 TaxID=2983246 RepID=UPI00338E885F